MSAAQSKPPTLAVIAERIAAHLRRFEADPVLRETQNISGPRVRLYYSPSAFARGSRVGVSYVSFQSETCVTKTAAAGYLAWLDAGNVGRHWEWERAVKADATKGEG